MLIIRGVNVFPTQIEEVLLKNPNLCAQYQLQVSRDGHLDKLDVYVEVRADLSDKISAQQRKGNRRRGEASHQVAGGGYRGRPCGRDRQGGAHPGRQGQAGHRQAAEIIDVR
jgi:hypothetical protein